MLVSYQQNGRWIGASITRGFCFICARIYKHVVLLPISTDSLLIIWSIILINNRLVVTRVSCNILTAILSVIRKKWLRKWYSSLIIDYRRHIVRVCECLHVLAYLPVSSRAHVFIECTTRIATNADSLVGRCASASSRSKFNTDWP